jgi:hypothetical protein
MNVFVFFYSKITLNHTDKNIIHKQMTSTRFVDNSAFIHVLGDYGLIELNPFEVS